MLVKCENYPLMKQLLDLRTAIPEGYNSERFQYLCIIDPYTHLILCSFTCDGKLSILTFDRSTPDKLAYSKNCEKEASEFIKEVLERYLVPEEAKDALVVSYKYVHVYAYDKYWRITSDKKRLLGLLPEEANAQVIGVSALEDFLRKIG